MMPKRNLDVERDADELLNVIEASEHSELLAAEIEDAQELGFVLRAPIDGLDSDKDDAGNDCEEAPANRRDIGLGVLS
ncbi:Hypothetical predicted protein [Octopus vulgaris]|uniref:Uncharacterized protein n=1 Tax=Octopus vulgaris TaxID=6645 RepID=A0AA36FBJ1_OCTVU|nr:Hypothetical predicted protein [Octopus vulgaris]